MAKIIIKCCVYETTNPIPNLIVTWYSTSELNIPETFKNSKNWEKLKKANWKELNLYRLGSSITDDTGISRLDYSLNLDRQDQGLWYTIQFPEVVGNISSGRVIHVGSETIANSAEYENLQIQFPKHVLEEHTLEDRSSLTIDSQKESIKINVALEKIENDYVRNKEKGGNRFSKKFNTKLSSAGKKRNDKSFKTPSIIVPFSLKFKNGKNEHNQKIEFDKKEKKWVLKNNLNDSIKMLNYKGITRYTKEHAENKKLFGPQIIINETNTELLVSLPKVPELLEVRELELSPLFKHSLSVLKSKTK